MLCFLCGITLFAFLVILVFVPVSPMPVQVGLASAPFSQDQITPTNIFTINDYNGRIRVTGDGLVYYLAKEADGSYTTGRVDLNGVTYFTARELHLYSDRGEPVHYT